MEYRNSVTLVLIFFGTAAFIGLSGCGPKITAKAAKVTQTSVESTITTTSSGTVEAEQQAVLGFSAPGRVSKIFTHIGDRVRRGQILAELENSDLHVIFEDSGKEIKRAQELFEAGLMARVALDDAQKNLEVARANLDKTIIKAPFDGVITELNLEIGELAQPGSTNPAAPPIHLIDLKPRIIKGDIDEVDLAKVHTSARARVKVTAVSNTPFEAKVTRVVPFVSTVKEKDRTSQIELKITKTDKLIPVGASADVEIIAASKDGVLALPSRTILGSSTERYVYRFFKGKIHKTIVQTGIGNFDRTEIISGLKEGDQAIFPPEDVDLKDGMRMRVEILPWP